jgi:hypothetical protein
MRFILFCLFIFTTAFSQESRLLLRIDSIATDNSNALERKFTINYHVENTTSETLSFFLNTKYILPNAVSSMSLQPSYKIYQDNEFLDIDGVFEFGNQAYAFHSNKTVYAKHLAAKDSIISAYKNNGGKSTEESWILRNQNLLNNTVVLNPRQTKSFSIIVVWDKRRYYQNDPLEFYLNEKSTHNFELFIHLMKAEFKDILSESEFQKITADKNFVSGIFTSNKVEINFGE